MALKTGNQTGLSNGIAKQEGFPTSGEVSANAGALPAQRAQQPFAQKRAQTNEPPQATAVPPMGRGTLNGGAVQGAQYRTAAQQMSPGVAGFVAIPSVTQKFAIPAAGMPGATPIQMNQQQQPSYFSGQGQGIPEQSQQQQQQQQAAPSAGPTQTPKMPAQQKAQAAAPTPDISSGKAQPMPQPTAGQPPPQPTATPPAQTHPQYAYNAQTGKYEMVKSAGAPKTQPTPTWDPNKQMYEMGSMYEQGGEWDVNQQQLLAEKQRQQNLAAAAQAQLMGRGGTIGQVAQNYANQMAALEYEQARASLHQQAQQQQFQNQMDYAKSIAQQKERLIAQANALGFEISEEDFNKMAADVVGKYGDKATEGQILEYIKSAAKPADPKVVAEKAKQLESLTSSWSSSAEASMVEIISKMNKQELKELASKHPMVLQKVLDDTWGADNDAIVAKLNDAGIYM